MTRLHSDVKLLNQSLVNAVHQENFAAAERLRLHLVSEFATIELNPVYERAALAQIRWDNKQDLHAFLTWLHLVPDNETPSRVQNGPFTKTRNILFRAGTPARNLLLITEFSLVCAAKGYGQLVWNDLVLLMSRFEHAEKAVAFFLSFEAALLRYYAKYHPGFVEEMGSRQRYLLIMLCCDAGWLEEAVQVVQKSEAYYIHGACKRLLSLLRARDDSANVALVEEYLHRRRLPSDAAPTEPQQMYSIRSIIEGSGVPRPRTWIASQLREVKRLISRRALGRHTPPGNILHQIMANYDACKGYSRGLSTFQKRALSRSDPTSYTWLSKEMYYLHQSAKFVDILTLFAANFHVAFIPPGPWNIIRKIFTPRHSSRHVNKVPAKLNISPANAWVVWDALVRLSVFAPNPLRVLEELHHSIVHYSSTLTDSQFRAFPTSYTAVFRSIVRAYGELSAVDKAVAAASDLAMIGKLHATHVVVLDELAAVHARAGNVRAATQLLEALEKLGPRVATYGLLMHAYLQAGLVEEASRLAARMRQKCHYVSGDGNWRMDATLAALQVAEDALKAQSVRRPLYTFL
ncbi:hypothetical protein B0H19DRAFT_1248507 [Mycena capillaripes]|nr:hypothetical protein B0H19DRAFT_1248507 [Mycena capillaripes]